MILFAVLTTLVVSTLGAAMCVQRTHAHCAQCHQRSTIRLTPSLLFPTLYCVRCRFEGVPSYDPRALRIPGGYRTNGTKS